MRLPLGLAILLVVAGHSQSPRSAARSAVFQRARLSNAENGLNGELELVQDSRLTPALRERLWGGGELTPDSPIFRTAPLRNAELRLVRWGGLPVESEPLERPLAKLESTRLYGGSRETYLLTVDYSAGFGSYSGPATFLLEVAGGLINWLQATQTGTGKKERITLARTLKSVWGIVDVPGTTQKEILQALCRPIPDSHEFTLTYLRYYFDGQNWVRLDRSQKGCSDFEDGLPDRSLFP